MIELVDQRDVKNMDSLGRLTVPVGLRRRLGLGDKTPMDVFTFIGEDGREFVAFTKSRKEVVAPNSKSENSET